MKKHFKYLDCLRESGAVNMYGAGRYLQDAFGLDKSTSVKILSSWMTTFDGKSSISERVCLARRSA